MANYTALGERLRSPDSIPGPTDPQLLRVWLRRKYIDKAWYAGFGSGGTGTGESKSTAANEVISSNANGTTYQPTKVSMPPKKKKSTQKSVAPAAPQPEPDLLGGMWDAPTPTPAPTPSATFTDNNTSNTDAEWDAFGASRASAGASDANDPFATSSATSNGFQADFSQMHAPVPVPAPVPAPVPVPAVQSLQEQSASNGNFPQANQMQQQNLVQNIPSTQPSFDTNFVQQNQVQNMASAQPSFGANFPQQQQQQNQTQNIPFTQPSFDATFSQNSSQLAGGNNMQMNMMNSSQQLAFNANFQQQGQGPSMPSPQQQSSFNTNFQQQNNQMQNNMSMPSAVQPSFESNFQQQQNNQMSNLSSPPQQNGFNNNNGGQLMPPPTVPQMSPPQPPKPAFGITDMSGTQQQLQQQQQTQASFNSNFDQKLLGSNRPLSPPDMPPQPPQVASPNSQGQHMQLNINVPSQDTSIPSNAGLQQPQTQDMQELQNQPNMGMQMNQMNSNMMQSSDSNMIPSPTSMSKTTPNGFASSEPTLPASNVNDTPTQEEKTESSVMSGMTNANDAFDAFSSLSIVSNNNNKPKQESVKEEITMNGNDNNVTSVPSNGDATPTSAPSMYQVGQKLLYTDGQGNSAAVEVIKVHLDDELVPFYDIKMQNGREKQTDNGHLKEIADVGCATTTTETALHDVSAKLASVTNAINGMNFEELDKVEQFIRSMMN